MAHACGISRVHSWAIFIGDLQQANERLELVQMKSTADPSDIGTIAIEHDLLKYEQKGT